MIQLPAVKFPRCSADETRILQLRARGCSFWRIFAETGIAPRRASDMYFGAMKKIVAYLEQDAFLHGDRA